MFIYPNQISFWILVVCLLAAAGIIEITGRKKAKERLNREEFLY
jgi:hypothetical protein